MFWILLAGLIVFFLLWILFSPLYLRVEWNEHAQFLQLQWWGLARVELRPDGDEWRFQVRVLFFKKEWPLLQLLYPSQRSKAPTASKTSKKGGFKLRHPLRKVGRLWHSFQVRRFQWSLDTDDFVLNAYLYPVFQQASRRTALEWQVNFKGVNELSILIENRLSRMLYAFFR